VRFTKIIYVRNSWCIVCTLNALMHALNALMHALMMHHDARVNAHAMQFTWIRMQCSLRECVYDAVCVFIKSIKSTKPSLFNPNDHCRFQIIMLVKTWFKSVNQLIVNSGINSLDLTDEIFCWYIIFDNLPYIFVLRRAWFIFPSGVCWKPSGFFEVFKKQK